MILTPRPRHALNAALIVMAVAWGCAVSSRGKPAVERVGDVGHRVVVTDPMFGSAIPVVFRYTDSWQTEEYGMFSAGGRWLEMIYAEVDRAFTVALDYQLPIEAMVATWHLNARQDLVWGPLGRIDTRLGTGFYRPYAHNGLRRSCAGFLVEWDEIDEDPQTRPGKVVFGYCCGNVGESLEDESVRSLIRGIRIEMPTADSAQKAVGHESPGDKGDDANRVLIPDTHIGTADVNEPPLAMGNSRFPFKFARYYRPSSGGGRRP